MAADAFVLYDDAKLKIHDGTFTLGSDTLKAALILSTHTPDVTDTDFSADINPDEHASANGYTQGGVTVTSSVTKSGSTVTFDISDPQWTASGGSIVARYVVLYQSSLDVPIAYCLMDNSPADVTVTTTNILTIQIHASGLYTAA